VILSPPRLVEVGRHFCRPTSTPNLHQERSIVLIQNQFLQVLKTKLANSPQILAGWLSGSFGRDQADRYSDIDLHLLVEDTESFRLRAREWLEELAPLVLYGMRFEGRMINALTDSGMRIDIWLHDTIPKLFDGEVAVLWDRNLQLSPCAKEGCDTEEHTEIAKWLHEQIEEFWRCMSLTPAVIGRQEYLVCFSGLAVELQIVTDLMITGYGQQRERGKKVLNPYLGPEHRAEVEAALQLEGLNPVSLVHATLALASLVRKHGLIIAERHGFSYPKELEETVLRYLEVELREMGLEHVWLRWVESSGGQNN
jgi:hypothetical protein